MPVSRLRDAEQAAWPLGKDKLEEQA